MGGGDGGVIVRNSIVSGLSDPTVHGQMPAWLTALVDPILAKEVGTWRDSDCSIVSLATHWALMNCA